MKYRKIEKTSLTQLSFPWVLGLPNIASALVGASKSEQIAENVRVFGYILSSDIFAEIDEVLR